MNNGDPIDRRFERALAFLQSQHDYYAAYHHHKEAMAYAGFTLYVGVVGAAVFSDAWPPAWGACSKLLALVAITGVWIFVLAYLKFQLLRRRWAALRRAGCERLLSRWIVNPPNEMELSTFPATSERRPSKWVLVADYVWPLAGAIQTLDPDQSVYPTAIAHEWVAREQGRTESIFHERMLIPAGWILFAISFLRTLLA